MKIDRKEIYEKFGGRCAYCGSVLELDWQVDHVIPKRHYGTNDPRNLVPACKICNHYKRALSLEDYRNKWLGGLHKRLSKLPKNPRTEKSIKRKRYLLTIAEKYGITPDKPFSGVFYFEKEM